MAQTWPETVTDVDTLEQSFAIYFLRHMVQLIKRINLLKEQTEYSAVIDGT